MNLRVGGRGRRSSRWTGNHRDDGNDVGMNESVGWKRRKRLGRNREARIAVE
jgi:hypothetical protein